MGRPGLTQAEFDVVADRLLAAGERPTVERMRQALGTGSSLTVQRLLDAWWKALGARLNASSAKLALPDAPEEVAALASQLWEQALAAARQHAEDALAGERAELAAARLEADARVAAAEQRVQAAAAQVADAAAALTAAQAQLGDRQALVDQLQAQNVEMTAARVSLAERVQALEAESAALRGRLDDAAREAIASREAQMEHVRAIEDRASREVDRARQETREQARNHATLDKERQQRQAALDAALVEARQVAAAASRDLAAEQARREVLEVQLAELRDRMAVALSENSSAKRRIKAEKKPASRPHPTRK